LEKKGIKLPLPFFQHKKSSVELKEKKKSAELNEKKTSDELASLEQKKENTGHWYNNRWGKEDVMRSLRSILQQLEEKSKPWNNNRWGKDNTQENNLPKRTTTKKEKLVNKV